MVLQGKVARTGRFAGDKVPGELIGSLACKDPGELVGSLKRANLQIRQSCKFFELSFGC